MVRTVFPAGSLLLAFAVNSVQAWNCYLPAGNHDNVGMTPCNATLADTPEGSACCDPRDSCTTTGMCLGASKYTYRGGCTDPTFAAAGCASMCLIGMSQETFLLLTNLSMRSMFSNYIQIPFFNKSTVRTQVSSTATLQASGQLASAASPGP